MLQDSQTSYQKSLTEISNANSEALKDHDGREALLAPAIVKETVDAAFAKVHERLGDAAQRGHTEDGVPVGP